MHLSCTKSEEEERQVDDGNGGGVLMVIVKCQTDAALVERRVYRQGLASVWWRLGLSWVLPVVLFW